MRFIWFSLKVMLVYLDVVLLFSMPLEHCRLSSTRNGYSCCTVERKPSRMILTLFPRPCMNVLFSPSIDVSSVGGSGNLPRAYPLPVHLESVLHLRVEVGRILSLVACNHIVSLLHSLFRLYLSPPPSSKTHH